MRFAGSGATASLFLIPTPLSGKQSDKPIFLD